MTDILKPEHLAVASQKINDLSAKLLDMQHIAEHGADPQAVQADFDKAVEFYTNLLTKPTTALPREPAHKPAEFNPQLPFGGLGGFWPKTNHDLVAANPRVQHDLAVMKDLSLPLQGLPLDALRRLREEVISALARSDDQYIVESFTVGDLKKLIEAVELAGRYKLEQDMRQAAEATLKEVELDLSSGEEFLSAVCPYHFLLMSAALGDVDRVNALAFELEKAQRKLAAAEPERMPPGTAPTDPANAGNSAGNQMDTNNEAAEAKPKGSEPTPAEMRAWQSYQWVCANKPNLIPRDGSKRYSRAMYDEAVKESPHYTDEDGVQIAEPNFDSWKRNLRGYMEKVPTREDPRPAMRPEEIATRENIEDLGNVKGHFPTDE